MRTPDSSHSRRRNTATTAARSSATAFRSSATAASSMSSKLVAKTSSASSKTPTAGDFSKTSTATDSIAPSTAAGAHRSSSASLVKKRPWYKKMQSRRRAELDELVEFPPLFDHHKALENLIEISYLLKYKELLSKCSKEEEVLSKWSKEDLKDNPDGEFENLEKKLFSYKQLIALNMGMIKGILKLKENKGWKGKVIFPMDVADTDEMKRLVISAELLDRGREMMTILLPASQIKNATLLTT